MQVFHICDEGRKVSFLCPNGTIFQQSDLICDWWFKVDCAISPTLYDESAEQLQEENLRRKENRKVFQNQPQYQAQSQPPPVNKVQTIPRDNARQDFVKPRKLFQAQRENQASNYAKKDVNQYTSNQQTNRYQEKSYTHSNNYQETQVPSETASFVNNRYTSENQQRYFKNLNINDVRQETTNVPPKSYITGDFTSVIKTSTEKINNRGGRTFSNKVQYTNQVSEQIKTTTQHTIYSPTVPPFTTSRLTTKTPAAFSTTEAFRGKPQTKTKSLHGFYITKEPTTIATNPPETTYTAPIYRTEKYFTNPRSVYTPSPFNTPTTQDPNIQNVETLHTTPAAVSKPLVGSKIVTGSDFTYDKTVQTRFGTTEYIDTTTETSATEVQRQSKQINLSTVAPFEDQSIKKTVPSIPTPFRTRDEILKDSSSTNQFNKFTYLPKTTDTPELSTPKPTLPTTLVTIPTVTDNVNNMIKTLEEIEGENPLLEAEKQANSRPGLHIPPSAGPKTLHSLAIYFATALDNLVVSNETNNGTEKSSLTTFDDNHVTLLSRMTQAKYNSLFDDTQDEFNITTAIHSTTETYHDDNGEHQSDLDLKTFVENDAQLNDLDGQQSRGPVSSSTPRIRQLAQVFTQALSAYLDDPDTFKKVLEEIRPTEPPLQFVDTTTEFALATAAPTSIGTTEYKSYTKEEDEVLDFSDADKSSTYKPYVDNNIKTTQPTLHVRFGSTTETYLNEISTNLPLDKENNINSTISLSKRIPTPNPIALDLNNGLKLSTSSSLQDLENIDETSVEDNIESDDYFPFNTGTDEDDEKKKATSQPYGLGVKPLNSTPIGISSQVPPTNSLLPPFKISLLHKPQDKNNSYLANEEYLQSAHSQSFLSHKNNHIGSERDGKSLKFNSTDNSIPTTTDQQYTTTTFYDYLTSTPQPTTLYDIETTRFYTSRHNFDDTTTENYYSTTTDNPTSEHTTAYSTYPDTTLAPTDQTTISKAVPNDHWSTSPEVTKLWETTLYVDPQIINRNLGDAESNPTTYRPEFSTLPYRTTTEYPDDSEEVDLRFSSTTTENPTDFSFSTLPSTTEASDIFTTVIDLGIHTLLNSTELEIASSQAQQIFGNLKTTEQDLLIEKMKEAESNSTVRRLILLLVSTCDASLSNNKTVQETRNSILHALLNMPSNTVKQPDLNSRTGKQLTLKREETRNIRTTTSIPVTTSKPARKISAIRSTIEVPNKIVDVKDVHQDTRALELLRSLYSLAAKWGKK